jgi:type II secretory pathway pseudopilin PulG
MDATPSRHHPSIRPTSAPRARQGFTLVEFLIVISIVMVLMGVLMPSLARSREAADRLRCASNLRQVGGALVSFLDDHNNKLPTLTFVLGESPKFCEGMILTSLEGDTFEGLGHLLPCAAGGYLGDARLLYCPCHRGQHPFDRYESQIGRRLLDTEPGTPAYCNYQYKSPIDPASGRQINNPMDSTKVLVADGFRTRADFNHVDGTNRLFGDGHVDWRADTGNRIYKSLPANVAFEAPNQYKALWNLIDSDGMTR